jgi:hypothetical protein
MWGVRASRFERSTMLIVMGLAVAVVAFVLISAYVIATKGK